MPGPDYFFCVAHEPPWFELPDHVEVIATGTYQVEGRLNIRDSRHTVGSGCLNISNFYPYLTGTAGSLYISELLQKRPTEGRSVCIFQYRKLISLEPIGAAAANYPYMRILGLHLGKDQVAEILASYATDLLISHPFLMPEGMLAQYANYHHVADFLVLTRIAVDLKVLQETEVPTFFETRLFVPGGVEFGIIPCDLFIDIMERLRPILGEFLSRHVPFAPHNAYQRRALSFFAERLGSYLLIKHLGWPTTGANPDGSLLLLPAQNVGYMCTLSESGEYRTFGHAGEAP
ncbi:hypothetical protein [Variovorax sp. EL159]|uniref:hypothetical protein n=1 Tax=Variovorax sp. EL159 TaxID=1566270 RepID=UPI000889F213|nr:hypothetical protein [Variovorax sp. EL159]SCX38765.1 hypothetical protein SAMN03159363_0070 [Variovorax sp. EL159]